MGARNYRPEIDGLRAVAVLGVLLFHLDLGFPGGFVGVDVFFVISGFLITGILLRQLGEDRFSLVDFWARRIRRIAPAAIVMVLGTLLIGGYLQTPDRYADLARSAMAHVVLASNCYFTRDQGYFAESSDLEPLLHTWSLSVEEQFYLIFPLVVVIVWRRWKEKLPWLLGATALLSFVWSWLEVGWDPKEAFFLLPSRGWELMAGALLAMAGPNRMGAKKRELISTIGLILILVPMFVFDRETIFPGPAALPSVLGAVMFIFAGGSSVAGRLLSWKPMVGIGLMSYSLYLWHWPLIVFVHEMNFELTLGWKISLLFLSFAMGYLSWRWIETPFRSGKLLEKNSRALKFGGATAMGIFAISLAIKMSGGFPSRLSPDLRVILEDIEWNSGEYTSATSEATALGVISDGPIDFVLWGDSHGASAAPAVDASAKKLGLRGRAYLNNGTPPVAGLWFADMSAEGARKMVAMNERVLKEIIEAQPRVVILVGRWVARCEGYNAIEMKGERASYRFATMVVDSMNPEPTFQEAADALIRQLRAMSERLSSHGITLQLMYQVPESTIGRTATQFYAQKRFPQLHSLPQFTTSRQEYATRQRRTMETLALLKGKVTLLDPTQQFFRENDQLKIYAERSYYRDEDHLSRAGSMHYLAPFFEKVMSPLRRAKAQ